MTQVGTVTVGSENATALPRRPASPTFVVWREFALVGRASLDGRKVSKEIAVTGARCRFEPTWCVASRRADSQGRIRGAPRAATTTIGGKRCWAASPEGKTTIESPATTASPQPTRSANATVPIGPIISPSWSNASSQPLDVPLGSEAPLSWG